MNALEDINAQIDAHINPLIEKISAWGQWLLQSVPNIILSILVLVIFYYLAKIINRLFIRYISPRFHSRTVAQLTAFSIKITIIALGILSVIGILGFHKTVFSLLAGAGIAGIAVGLAFQETAANIIAGIILSVKKPFRTTHLIRIGNSFGEVDQLELRATKIRGRNGEMIVIPNKEVINTTLINYSYTGVMRKVITVGVRYSENLNKVTQVLREAIEALPYIRKDIKVNVFALEFGDSSINFSVRFWIDYPNPDVTLREAEHHAVLAIKEALDKNNIVIPFPIRTLDFDKEHLPKITSA